MKSRIFISKFTRYFFFIVFLIPCFALGQKIYITTEGAEQKDTIQPPWDKIDLAATEAKILTLAPVVEDGAFPWLPVIGGVVVVGTVTYFLIKEDDDDPVDCSFTASAQTIGSTCGLSNGSISIQVNPADDYTYAWSNGATGSMIAEVTAGTYTATISRTGTSCTEVVSATVTNQDLFFDATVNTQPSSCDSENGSAIVTPVPPGNYTYVWSNGVNTQHQSNLAPGYYTVTVSAGGTCEKTFPVQIGTLPFEPSVLFTTTPSTCGEADGTATITVDPPDTYVYTWSDGQTGEQVSGLAGGSYSVTVSKDGTTCTHVASVIVDELSPSFSITITPTPTGCGFSDGTATVTVDPPGEYDFTWSNGQTGAQISDLAAGDYVVTVTVSGTDCSKQASVTIGSDPFPYTVAFTTTPSHCGAADGSASVLVTPQGEFGYQWSNGGKGAQLTGLGAGTYTLTVTDVVTSCAETFSVTVDELPAEITLSFTTTPAGCGVSDGSATVIADPPATYTYLWSNGNTTPQLSGVSSGTYSVTVTIAGTLCSNAASVEVEQAGGGFTATFTTDNADCGVSNGSANIIMDPPAEYSFLWSNQQTGPVLQQINAGTYSVTVTDANSCKEVFSITVGEDPSEFISVVNTLPGNCTGGGEIMFTLSTPGQGPLNVQVEGPQGTMPISLAPGTYQLSAFISVLPGTYTFTVYDEQNSTNCIEIETATVQDNTPALVATNDFYTTPGGQSVIENALGNDSGLNIVMTSVSDVFGGTVTFSSTGQFSFIPDQGFNGEAHFTYTIMDDCGISATGIVTITVQMVNCDFSVEFELTAASCGLEDGAIIADVIEPGMYAYVWSNGDSGPAISALFAGTYSVTITDINLGCNLTFSVGLTENPAEYIDDINITQPACGVDGEIQFTANTNSGNQLILTITHPNGLDQFFVSSGDIFLSDYISITPGDYLIEVTDEDASGDCIESFEATLVAAPMLEIIVEAVIPPSEPTAMDGFVIITTIVQGTLPYTVLLNGVPYISAVFHTFQVSGLGVGEYTIQIVDATGCVSNILDIFIPLPGITFSLGTSWLETSVNEVNGESATYLPTTLWRSMVTSSLAYYVGKTRQELMARFAVPVADQSGFTELVYMTDIRRYTFKSGSVALQGGMGNHFEKHEGVSTHSTALPKYLLLKASSEYTIADKFRVQGSIEMRGWDSIEEPRIEIGFSIPFLKRSFRWITPAMAKAYSYNH